MSAELLTPPRLRARTRNAMGSYATVAADLPDEVLGAALDLIDRLEAEWSRFRPHSIVARLAAGEGPLLVGTDTATVLAAAITGKELTNGWFDPVIGGDLWLDIDIGLARSYGPLDLGGIGKGSAADRAAAALVAAKPAPTAVMAGIGGDVVVRGNRIIEVPVASPNGSGMDAILRVQSGGIAMSGPTRIADHLVDPKTGGPAVARVAVVVAATGAQAELLATAAAVAPAEAAREFLGTAGVAAWLTEADGRTSSIGPTEQFLADPGWLAATSGGGW